jgi:TolB-like protein
MTSSAGQTPSVRSAASKPRLVVIPFDRPEQIPAWMPDDDRILMAAIVTALRQANQVTVSTAPPTIETPRDRAAIAQVGRTLKADYLLEGGVTEFGSAFDRPAGSSALQITFQLFDGRTGALVWVDEANSSSAAPTRAAALREMSLAAARAVADRVTKTGF